MKNGTKYTTAVPYVLMTEHPNAYQSPSDLNLTTAEYLTGIEGENKTLSFVLGLLVGATGTFLLGKKLK